MNDKKIKGIVVDAGHGGVDSGAVGNGLQEKDLNLQAATYMYNRLKELGIPTTITRDIDETLERDERVSRILESFGNDPNVILVSNHINAGGGEFIYHYKELIERYKHNNKKIIFVDTIFYYIKYKLVKIITLW